MRTECLADMSAVLGRKVSKEEGDQIVKNIRQTMTRLSRENPDWGSMTHDQRVRMAADEVSKIAVDQAIRRKENLVKQINKQNEALQAMERHANEEDLYAFQSVGRQMNEIDHYAKGISNQYLSKMLDTLGGLRSKFFGFVEDKQDVIDFVRESYGIHTGNERAAAAWKVWSETSEDMRQRAIEAGADIGKLDYGYIPQSHDAFKLAKAAKILKEKELSNQQAWIEFIWDKLDRSRYLDENGDIMGDADYREMLEGVYDTILSGDSRDSNIYTIAEKRPQALAKRKKYNSRALHFVSPEAWVEYQSTFGQGSLSTALIGHVQHMASDIALMERWGPQPTATFDMLKYTSEKVRDNAVMQMHKDGTYSWSKARKYDDTMGVWVGVDQVFDVLTGKAYHVNMNHHRFANIMQTWRNLEVAGKLGKAFITSFSDIPTYFVAARFNQIPFMDALKMLPRAYGREWKQYAAQMGLVADSMISDYNRWAGDNLGENWSSKLANLTMRASFLTAFTDSTRRAFSLCMSVSLARLSKTNWEALSEFDRARLVNGGISKTEWELFQRTQLDQSHGLEFLNPQKIADVEGYDEAFKTQATSKLIAYIVSESEMASLNPDIITRASTTRGLQKGTIPGELARAVFLFKSFPIAMMRQHNERSRFLQRHANGKVDRCKYLASIAVSTTMLGAISLQIQNMLNGKDLQDTTSSEFWLNAMAKGGGLGFLGDFIANQFSENARYGAWSMASLFGPQVSTGVEALDTMTKLIGYSLYDKETKPAASAFRIAKSHMPFINMWYTQTILDRYVMNDIQEYLSPGYLARMERRTYRSWGQGYWWGPRDTAPRRAPRMADQPQN